MNELETLNMLLRLIGSSPVNSLSTDHPDAANARATMNRIRRTIQRRGWWCNVDYNIIVYPDSAGVIRIPKTVSSAKMENCDLVVRDGRLYDKRNQTAIFEEQQTITRWINLLDWDDMPDVMQEACAYRAAAEFVRDELEDPNKENSLNQTATASYLDLKKQELEEGQYNIFNKARVMRARSGIMPYQRNNKRFYGDPDV